MKVFNKYLIILAVTLGSVALVSGAYASVKESINEEDPCKVAEKTIERILAEVQEGVEEYAKVSVKQVDGYNSTSLSTNDGSDRCDGFLIVRGNIRPPHHLSDEQQTLP